MRSILLILLLCLPAYARPSVEFIFPEQTPTPAERQALGVATEYMHTFYRHLGYALPTTVRIHIFPSLAHHLNYQKQHARSRNTVILATSFYDPESREIFTWRKPDLQRTLIHETNHSLFSYSNRPPTWLNEGLSELFGNMTISGGKATIEPHPEKIAVLTRLAPGKLGQTVMPVVDLDYFAFHDERLEEVNYLRSWALVYYLHRQRKLEGMIPKILESAPDENNSGVLSRAYLGGVQALNRQMELFYRSEF